MMRPRTTSPKTLSVVVPAFNEATNLPHLVARVESVVVAAGYVPEIIVVDDGSRDATREVVARLHAEHPCLKAVFLSRNFGKEKALAAGLLRATGDAVILMDADLQHPPEVIPDLLREFESGFDMVYAVRQSRETDTALHRLSAKAFYVLFNLISGTHLPEGAGDFRLLSRKAMSAMNQLGERSRFNKGLYSWIGFRSTAVPFTVHARESGSGKWRYRNLLRFAFDGVASFSIVPLRMASYLGVLISLAAFSYALFFVIKTWIFGIDQPGFPTLVVSIMFFSGIQLVFLGLIGEYLGRIYEEVKGRPLVLVDDTLGFDNPQRTRLPSSDTGDA